MRRRLLNLAAAVSLIVCVATISLWVRSYFMYDLWIARSWRSYSSAESWRGVITISHVRTLPQHGKGDNTKKGTFLINK